MIGELKRIRQDVKSKTIYERKLRVAMDWTLDLFFTRDIVLLKTFMKKTSGEIPLDTSGSNQVKNEATISDS